MSFEIILTGGPCHGQIFNVDKLRDSFEFASHKSSTELIAPHHPNEMPTYIDITIESALYRRLNQTHMNKHIYYSPLIVVVICNTLTDFRKYCVENNLPPRLDNVRFATEVKHTRGIKPYKIIKYGEWYLNPYCRRIETMLKQRM